MAWKLWDYKSKRGINEIEKWTRKKLEKTQMSSLNSKLNQLRINGPFLSRLVLSDTPARYIKKLRFETGNVTMRPLLCEGPDKEKNGSYKKEFTLLCGAKEIGSGWEPKRALVIAQERRKEVLEFLKYGNKRRVPHVKVVSKSKK